MTSPLDDHPKFLVTVYSSSRCLIPPTSQPLNDPILEPGNQAPIRHHTRLDPKRARPHCIRHDHIREYPIANHGDLRRVIHCLHKMSQHRRSTRYRRFGLGMSQDTDVCVVFKLAGFGAVGVLIA